MEPVIWDATHHVAFLAAAHHGDLDAVKRHFQRPYVLQNVAAWNAVFRTKRTGDPAPTTTVPHYQWFGGQRPHEHLFASTILYERNVDVIRWFVAREQLELLGETLRGLAKNVHESSLFPTLLPCREIIAIVLDSALFTEIMDDADRRELLAVTLNAASSRGSDKWVDLLLAYGADPNFKYQETTPLTAVLYKGTVTTLNVLLAHGAWIHQAKLFSRRAYNRAEGLVGELLRRGADANAEIPTFGSVLHEAANCGNRKAVRVLIEQSFADVDARDHFGCTPLLVVAGVTSMRRRRRSPPHAIAKLLLDAGADLHAVDNLHRGVLHHVVHQATRDWSLDCLRLYLERGANPNVQDSNRETPMATLLGLHTHDEMSGNVKEMLTLLLGAGGDPFLCDLDGSSVVHMLERSESGLAFLLENLAFFIRRNRQGDVEE